MKSFWGLLWQLGARILQHSNASNIHVLFSMTPADPPVSLLVCRVKGTHPRMWDGGKGYLAKDCWAEAAQSCRSSSAVWFQQPSWENHTHSDLYSKILSLLSLDYSTFFRLPSIYAQNLRNCWYDIAVGHEKGNYLFILSYTVCVGVKVWGNK